jgi:hypothetical protein
MTGRTMPITLTQPQLELLFHAGLFGLSRIPAAAVEDLIALREAGLVALDGGRAFQLTSRGERHVAAFGGQLTARHLH